MEDVNGFTESKKRSRGDSELEFSDSERDKPEEPDSNLPESKRIREDILEILDDSDTLTDRDPVVQDLDSVIKSFEEEILHQPLPQETEVIDMPSGPGDSLPELGYLLEASDDELGLPPTISPADEKTNDEATYSRPSIPILPAGFEGMLGFDDDMPSYDSFAFGMLTDNRDYGDVNGEYVTLGGLFDSDYAELLCRPESMPAV